MQPGVEVRFFSFICAHLGIDESASPPWVQQRNQNPWGYCHMIRFFFVDIFETAALQGFRYWLRMDTDSEWTRSAPLAGVLAYLDANEDLAYLHNNESEDLSLGKTGQGDACTGTPVYMNRCTRRNSILSYLRYNQICRGPSFPAL